MRGSNRVNRALPGTAIVGLLVTFVSFALLLCGVAAADTVETDFEVPLFHLGSVNKQDGWKSATPFDIPSLPHGYDQAVVANSGAPPAFGGQSLRFSNGYNVTGPTEYHFQTYSKPTKEAAGESLANTEYTAQFSFISTKPAAEQPGLFAAISPDEGEGGRMSYIGLADTPSGIDVIFYATPKPDGEFAAYDLGTVPRDKPHTIKFWMKLNPGPNNDFVRILIDGRDTGECFTAWENLYRHQSQAVPTTNTLLFRSSGEQENLSLVGGGYLFDNVTITTAKGAGPPTCDLPIEKKADARTVSPGGRVGYRITVRNRGRLSARNVLVCDRIPREMTFVSADRKLLRLGRRRCLLIPHLAPGQRVSFHLVLHVDAHAPPGTEANVAEETPGAEPPGQFPRQQVLQVGVAEADDDARQAPAGFVIPGQVEDAVELVPLTVEGDPGDGRRAGAARTSRRPPAPPRVTG